MKAEDLISILTRCSFSLVQEMGSFNHAEHYQVYKNVCEKEMGFVTFKRNILLQNERFHPLLERYTFVLVCSLVTMAFFFFFVSTWANVLGCVSLLSLSSLLLCISLGNDFGDASSPLTATLAS